MHVTRGDSRGYGERGYGVSRATVSTGVRRAGLRAAGLRRAGLRRAGLGEHYAGYGVDEEVLEAAYDAGAYTARGTRAIYGGEPAYDSEPYDEHFDG